MRSARRSTRGGSALDLRAGRRARRGPRAAPVAAVGAHAPLRQGSTAVEALRGVDLEVAAQELVAVMGPSGSGKSTLMHLLAGLDTPTSGSVRIAGIELGALDDGELTRLRRDHIGFVFQFFNLLPMLDAEENVTAAAVDRRRAARAGMGRRGAGAGGPRAAAHPPARRSCPAASSSVWRSRAP